MLYLLLLTLNIDNNILSSSEELNYYNYHQKIIEAEELIFLQESPIKGLKKFEECFKTFDFLFVDDCIEAFQLALFYKEDDLALYFIQRALDNGFRLTMLDYLNCGSPHNYYQGINTKVTIHNNFLKKNEEALSIYQDSTFNIYVKSIDRKLLTKILDCHIKEQIFKDHGPALNIKDREKQKIAYQSVCDDNLAFIKFLYKNNIYIGEKNIGVLSNELLSQLDIMYLDDNNELKQSILDQYKLPKNTHVSVQTEKSVFSIGVVYNIMFHNKKSFHILAPYHKDAIKKGYLHPRDYASLQFKRNKIPDDQNMYLDKPWKEVENINRVNELRAFFNLPKYEIDQQKFLFAQENNLKLCFGFFNGTR